MAVVLLLIIVIASASMTFMNYYTIKILSAARAYINGESQYSKGEKDATAHLINYIYLENETDYAAFEKAIDVPKGDRVARIALSSNYNYQQAKEGFLRGKNHAGDIDDMVWLFNSFQHLDMFEKV